jgi:hypothetical protein
MFLVLVAGGAFPAGATQVVMGGRGGYGVTDLVGSNDDGIGTRSGAVLGFLVGWEINPWFSVRFEPDVTLKGADLEGYAFGDLPTSLRFTYVELPLLATFKHAMTSDPRNGFFATAGPVLGVNTKAEARYAGADNNVQDAVTSTDFGIGVGLGYEIAQAEKGVVSFEVRYVIGLTDVFEESVPRPEVLGDLKNRALQFSIGWFGGVF